MIKHAIFDLDSVAYIGACIAQKANYKWVNPHTEEATDLFKSAKDAKVWMEGEVAFGSIEDPTQWVRETVINTMSEEEAIRFTEKEMKNWIKSVRLLTENPNINLKGYLTASGKKTKDIAGLEKRYQFNRYKDEACTVPIDKPVHLKACREFILRCFDWVKMSPEGFEADAVVVYQAEKIGKEAVIVSKDKDLRQAMNTNFIDMNFVEKYRKIEPISELGHLEIVVGARGKSSSLKGGGFKYLCAQTIAGDRSDGYLGVAGKGLVTAYELFKDCKSVQECCEVLISTYRELFPQGHKYTSWDGQDIELTADELLTMHCQLAYHERGKSDTSNPIQRYLQGLDPIKRYD